MRFAKRKGTEVLIAITEKGERVFLIGRVFELMRLGVIEMAINPTFENWLLIDTEGNSVEFQTKEDAKTAARLKYE